GHHAPHFQIEAHEGQRRSDDGLRIPARHREKLLDSLRGRDIVRVHVHDVITTRDTDRLVAGIPGGNAVAVDHPDAAVPAGELKRDFLRPVRTLVVYDD